MTERPVFIVSDQTAITAETLTHSLLSQFPDVAFVTLPLPFVDSDDKVDEVVTQIDAAATRYGVVPLVFTSFVNDSHRDRLRRSKALHFDLFETFLGPLEQELGAKSTHHTGRAHGMVDAARYTSRIQAVNFSVYCDDGLNAVDYERANVILVGVSRSGKTPTCLYLALHFGVFAANYPLTEEDFDRTELAKCLQSHRQKLFGLTIEPEQLRQIRLERRGESSYADPAQCRREVEQAEAQFRHERIPFVNTTRMSIEEISTTVLQRLNLKRDLY